MVEVLVSLTETEVDDLAALIGIGGLVRINTEETGEVIQKNLQYYDMLLTKLNRAVIECTLNPPVHLMQPKAVK